MLYLRLGFGDKTADLDGVREVEVMDLIRDGLKAVLALLPDSPFKILDNMAPTSEIAKLLGMVNWFIPIYSFIGILEGWLVCVGVYYVYQIVLRWLNAIE